MSISSFLRLVLILLLIRGSIVNADSLFGMDLGSSWTVAQLKSGEAGKDPDIAAFKFALQKMETKVFFTGDKASFAVVIGPENKIGYHCSGVTIHRGTRMVISEADRLNGVQQKWFFHIQVKAHRSAKDNEWTAWRDGPPMLGNWTAVYIEQRNGDLHVVAPDNYEKLQKWVVK